jgi:hypothetical protein
MKRQEVIMLACTTYILWFPKDDGGSGGDGTGDDEA